MLARCVQSWRMPCKLAHAPRWPAAPAPLPRPPARRACLTHPAPTLPPNVSPRPFPHPSHPTPTPARRLWQLQSKMAAVGGEGTYEARLDRVTTARAGLEERLQVGGVGCGWRGAKGGVVWGEVGGCAAGAADAHARFPSLPPASAHHPLLLLAATHPPAHPPPSHVLQKRIELVDAYARVIAMIEIEVGGGRVARRAWNWASVLGWAGTQAPAANGCSTRRRLLLGSAASPNPAPCRLLPTPIPMLSPALPCTHTQVEMDADLPAAEVLGE